MTTHQNTLAPEWQKYLKKEPCYTLNEAERDLSQVYYKIRSSRTTNWKAVNEAREIKAAMMRMGVTEAEFKAAIACLKKFDCSICGKNRDMNIPCYMIGERRKAGQQIR